jgi:metal-sulfur cluster biosynthetic enzyme
MTSAACPVVDVILEDIEHQLDDVAPEGMGIEIELVWSPVWTPERISARAREFMGW